MNDVIELLMGDLCDALRGAAKDAARQQLQLNSQAPDTFHLPLAPTPQQRANLAGGVYTIESSFINIPLASPAHFVDSNTDWGPAA